MSRRRLRWAIVALALVGWAVGIAWWATQPVEDTVPVGGDPGRVTVTCATPWSSDPGPTGQLPVLEATQGFQHDPCAAVHADSRRLLFINVGSIAVVGIAMAWYGASHVTREPDPSYVNEARG